MWTPPGVFLLLLVTVLQAVAGKKEVICENSKTTLSCPSNQVIKIKQATYGRSNKKTCKHPKIKTTRCSTKKPLVIISKNCDWLKSCVVAANNGLYGDPCPGTYKYVTVSYSCQDKTCRKKCHKYAECSGGKCVCRSAWHGDGIKSCISKRVLLVNCKRKCGGNRKVATWLKKCVCKPGYQGDGIRSCSNRKFKGDPVPVVGPLVIDPLPNPSLEKSGAVVVPDAPAVAVEALEEATEEVAPVAVEAPEEAKEEEGTTPSWKKCHKKAKCIKGVCVCKSGQGDGVISCGKEKDKKCREKCHKKAMCRRGKCVCRFAWRGDGIKSCISKRSRFWLVKCKRKCGGNRKVATWYKKCVCKPGYQGDGIRSWSNRKFKGAVVVPDAPAVAVEALEEATEEVATVSVKAPGEASEEEDGDSSSEEQKEGKEEGDSEEGSREEEEGDDEKEEEEEEEEEEIEQESASETSADSSDVVE